VIVNGTALEHLPQTSLTGILASTVHSFALVAQNESSVLNLRVHEFLISSRVAGFALTFFFFFFFECHFLLFCFFLIKCVFLCRWRRTTCRAY
jgi:hypothetical protein